MEKTKVSIIIPVYNVEAYLSQCVDSVLEQTHQNLQIILVDDGSTDGSGGICDWYAAKDSRVTVIHKENGGLSSARNAGLPEVSGDYVFYLDSDDYLDHDAVAGLLEAQNSSGAEAVVGSYLYTYEDREDVALCSFLQNVTLSTWDAMEALAGGKLQNFAWGKLIRADIAKKHLFPEGKLFEDTFWTHHVFHECSSVCVLTRPIIHYRQRSSSISYSYTIKRLDVLEGWSERLRFFEETYPELVPVYLKQLVSSILAIAWLTLTRMKKNRREAFRKLAAFSSKYHLTDYASDDSRILLDLLQKSVTLYAVKAFINRFKRGN